MTFCADHDGRDGGLPSVAARGTIVTMTTDSLRNVKDRFSEFVDRVDREHERVVVTRNGRPAAVMISPDDLESLEETLAILGDTEAVKALAEAEAAVAVGRRRARRRRGAIAPPRFDLMADEPYELVLVVRPPGRSRRSSLKRSRPLWSTL